MNSSLIKRRIFKEDEKREEICSFRQSCVPIPEESGYQNLAQSLTDPFPHSDNAPFLRSWPPEPCSLAVGEAPWDELCLSL
jgi:hypothetical protein